MRNIEYVAAKSLLSPVPPTENYICRDYNMNIYRGCCHGCIYCDSRSLCYRIEDFDRVRAKANALSILEDDLRRRRKKGLVATGAMSDPYNPYEQRLRLTGGALELLHRYGFGVSVTTKAPLIARDADILSAIAADTVADVRLTIIAADDALSHKLEPGVAPASERFKALSALSSAGVYTGVFITPTLPYITDNEANIRAIVTRAADCGASNVVCMMGVTMRAGNREYFYKALDSLYPGLRERYDYEYGERYVLDSPRAKALWELFTGLCKEKGLLYSFKRINAALSSRMNRQSSLFDM